MIFDVKDRLRLESRCFYGLLMISDGKLWACFHVALECRATRDRWPGRRRVRDKAILGPETRPAPSEEKGLHRRNAK